jgi:hypothetical protein
MDAKKNVELDTSEQPKATFTRADARPVKGLVVLKGLGVATAIRAGSLPTENLKTQSDAQNHVFKDQQE